MSTLIEPIKAELGLSDFSIAFLSGALAFFYVTAGLPLAYLADRANRRTLVAAALAAWSLVTACCGIVQNYGQMLAARIGGSLRRARPAWSLHCTHGAHHHRRACARPAR